ncbi:hypothetical protein EUGRSUZ_B02786 [Eucalyptus grandis]|uniref:Uncharacterized protein n=2 Tax=Eucalyptus grandis TaxID=71139 RepID=A0ACC3M1V5_EUCGR|nr:hypothetical protein EUGRSUZ_B02786 [Eucalyptus grandis]
MNPTTEPPPPPLPLPLPLPQFQPPKPPPQPPQPHRRTCERHPEEHFTGFCPSCICERLALLEPSSSSSSAAPAASASASSSSRKPPSSAAASALKALFKPSSSSSSSKPPPPASASAFLPELRRTKSFSASKNEGFFSGIFEPQRKSCDVRVGSTLFTLFSLDDDRNPSKRDSTRNSNAEGVQAKNLGPAGVRGPVLESKEEEDAGAGSDYQQSKEYIVQEDEEEEEDDEIRAWEEPDVAPAVVENRVQEIVEEEEEEAEIEETAEPELEVVPEEEVKTMKDHIDLDSQAKKSSGRDLVGVGCTRLDNLVKLHSVGHAVGR